MLLQYIPCSICSSSYQISQSVQSSYELVIKSYSKKSARTSYTDSFLIPRNRHCLWSALLESSNQNLRTPSDFLDTGTYEQFHINCCHHTTEGRTDIFECNIVIVPIYQEVKNNVLASVTPCHNLIPKALMADDGDEDSVKSKRIT